MTDIVARSVTKSFARGAETITAVDGLSFRVRAGEIVALTGPSGSGKSTVLDLLMGWQRPDSGEVALGHDRAAPSIGVVPQHLGLHDELTSRENASLASAVAGRWRPPDAASALTTDEMFVSLALGGLEDRLPSQLSLGQQQRVAVARALLGTPDVVIADEPTSHQDSVRAQLVMDELRRAATAGAAVVLTSHDRRIVECADRVISLADGTLDEQATSSVECSADTSSDALWAATRPLGFTPFIATVVCVVLASVASLLALNGRSAPGALALPDPASAPSPDPAADWRIDEFEIASDALGSVQRTLVFVPESYDDATEPLPTVYLFHGQVDGPEQFVRTGFFRRAGELMAQGSLAPAIIVAPTIDNSFGVSNEMPGQVDLAGLGVVTYQAGRYEDFLAVELIPSIEGRYAVGQTRDDRSVGGISMGGFAALHLALKRPDLFARVGAHSPALIDDFDWLYPTETVRAQRDPRMLARSLDVSDDTAFYLDVGEQDPFDLVGSVIALAEELEDKAEVTVVTRPGGHDDIYWRQRVDEYLAFYLD